jgi:hypothetical protein
VVILLVLWAAPALIIFWLTHPSPLRISLDVCVFLMSTEITALYFFGNKDAFPSVAVKIPFITGILLGPLGVINIFS